MNYDTRISLLGNSFIVNRKYPTVQLTRLSKRRETSQRQETTWWLAVADSKLVKEYWEMQGSVLRFAFGIIAQMPNLTNSILLCTP